MKYIKNLNPKTVYFIFSLSGILIFAVAIYFYKIQALTWLSMEHTSSWATFDYYRHIFFAINRNKIYEYGVVACFPPLAYVFYYIIARITISNPSQISNYKNYYDACKVLFNQPYQIIVFLMYTIVGILIICFAINELEIKKYQKNLMIFSIIFSTPMFMGAIEHGNMALYVIGLLLFALIWHNSENKIKRELALIFIAVAAGLKIYPAFFGLLYLKEKRWKEALRLVIYGIILFFIPFIYCGGFYSMKLFFNNIFYFTSRDYFGRVQFIKGLLMIIGINNQISQYLSYVFLMLLFALILLSNNNIRITAFLASAMAFFPSGAYRYTLIYFLLPLIMLFIESKEKNFYNYLNAIFLGLLFSIPSVFGVLTQFRLYRPYETATCTGVECYIYVIAWFYLVFQVISEITDLIKSNFKALKVNN